MPIPFKLANFKLAIAGAGLCALLAGCNEKRATPPLPSASNAAPLLSIAIQRNGHWITGVQTSGDKSHRMLLDTGASFNMLPAEGALAAAPLTQEAQAALLKQGTLKGPGDDGAPSVITPGEPRQIKLGLNPALRIQGWSMPSDTLALQGKLGALAAAEDASFDGIIGIDSMRDLTWRADYVTGTLTAYAGEAPEHEWQQCTFMTLDTRTRTPLIELSLGDEHRFFILDTGYDADLLVSQEVFEHYVKAKRFPKIGASFSAGVTDRLAARPEGLLSGLTIGQKRLPTLAVSGGSPDQRLGMGLLEKMDRFELDFRRFRFCFDLPAVPENSALAQENSILERRGERYEVLALLPDGRLAQSGVKAGDQIEMVDQISVKTLNLAQLGELLSNPATGELTVLRGKSPWIVPLKKLAPA
ncbi:MAG: hypothetical protein LBV73_25195 [Paraburkholderia sp.]|jgi:predicted aspartyl protease|nr:hypothetical protein [Paraburkholderia sp.]